MTANLCKKRANRDLDSRQAADVSISLVVSCAGGPSSRAAIRRTSTIELKHNVRKVKQRSKVKVSWCEVAPKNE